MIYPGLGLTPAESVVRATTAVHTHREVRYRLSEGGKDPSHRTCATPDPRGRPASDCIGFVTWASGIPRFRPHLFSTYGGWINTDSAIIDARGPRQGFVEIPRWQAAVGDWVVYGRRYLGLAPGHVGIVTSTIPRLGIEHWDERLGIAHCSGSAQRRMGYAISFIPSNWRVRATVLRIRDEFRTG